MAYDPVAKAFHWLTLLAVVGLIALGWTMVGLSLGPTKLQYYSWHKWLGMTVLIATLLRLVWRRLRPPPPLPAIMPAWERMAATSSHYGLYLLLLAMPLTGWTMSSASGFPVMLYGAIPLPDLVGRDEALEILLKAAHYWEGVALIALAIVHALAALKHHILDKDDVLRRMLPFGGPR